MFKNQHRKLLFFGFLIFLGLLGALFFSNFILAQSSDWHRVVKNGGSETIDKHAICWVVTNNRTDYDVFVPVKTLAEWQAFINSIQNESYPQNVVLSPCLAVCPICHSGTPPSCAPETTNWGANLYGCEGYNKRCFEGECKVCEEDDGITRGLIHSDGCIPSEGCVGQGGNACWRYVTTASPLPSGYSCVDLCSYYHSCAQANWNDPYCEVVDFFSNGYEICVSQCEWEKGVGWHPPDYNCHNHCCRLGDETTWGDYVCMLPAVTTEYPGGAPPPPAMPEYYRDPSVDVCCGGEFLCNRRLCVCQY